jgi:hypothetical protein
MPIASHRPTRHELRALRGLVKARGESETLEILGLHREPLARMLAGFGVRAGTVFQLRARLGGVVVDSPVKHS